MSFEYKPESEFTNCPVCYSLQADFDAKGQKPSKTLRVSVPVGRSMGHLMFGSRDGRVRLCAAQERMEVPQVGVPDKTHNLISTPNSPARCSQCGMLASYYRIALPCANRPDLPDNSMRLA